MRVTAQGRWFPRAFLPAFAVLAAVLPAGCRSPAPAGIRSTRFSRPRADPTTSLVRVAVTAQAYQFLQPWDRAPAARRRGLGVVVEGGRVLVPASLVADATFIDLEQPADGRRLPARVVARDYESNLALLEPDEDGTRFLEGAVALRIDTAARAGDPIDAWQLEGDGSPVITRGRLLRIEVGRYALPGFSFLRYVFQGSLERKEGTYIMPAIRKGRLAGLFLDYRAEDQTSRLIPAPVIDRFMRDVAAGGPVGFPRLGVRTLPTTDEALRQYLRLPESGGGVYVSHVAPGGPADTAGLQVGDVILSIDGFPIDRRRYYVDPDFGPLSFSHLVAGRKGVDDRVLMDVWRDGAAVAVHVVLGRTAPADQFIDPYMFDRGPRYFILGGLVFTELSRPYLQSFRDGEANAPLLLRHAAAYPEAYSEGREKLVILSRIIPTAATVGYEPIAHTPVEEVNGRAIGSLRDLAEAVAEPVDGRHAVVLTGAWPTLYLDAARVEQANRQLSAFGIAPLFRID